MNELKQLEKKVVDTYAAWDATCAAWDSDYDSAAADAAYVAWVKAKRELNEYLKEQDNE